MVAASTLGGQCQHLGDLADLSRVPIGTRDVLPGPRDEFRLGIPEGETPIASTGRIVSSADSGGRHPEDSRKNVTASRGRPDAHGRARALRRLRRGRACGVDDAAWLGLMEAAATVYSGLPSFP